MGKAYSQDLRLRALAALDSGLTKMAVHQTFGISRSTIDDWLRLRAEQGHVRDKPVQRQHTGGALGDLAVFGEFAARHAGATLGQMVVAWEQEQGRHLSINTFSLALQRLGWTRKKRASCTKSEIPCAAKSSSTP